MKKIHPEAIEKAVKKGPRLSAAFFRQSASGSGPVREWLRGLPANERRAIGEDIKAVQIGWPMGLPLVDHLEGGVWGSGRGCPIALQGFCSPSRRIP